MTDKRMEMLGKLQDLINRDETNKRHAQKLNEDIQAFIEGEIGLKGNFTLLDISKKLLELSVEPSRIITP